MRAFNYINWPNKEACVRYDSEALDNLGGEAGLNADIVDQHLSLSCFFDSRNFSVQGYYGTTLC